MASNITKTPILRAISKHNYATATKVAQASADIQVKTLPNKLVLAVADSEMPISRVSLLFRAGSRYETPENLGVSNIVRSSGGLSTSGASAFGIMRNLQQIGASLSVTSDRESISYTLDATPDNIEKALPFLIDVTTKQLFKPWELEDQVPRIKYELATIPPQAKVLDLVAHAAYRIGLGNSVFVKDYNIGKISPETLQYFVGQNYTAPRAALVGVGVSLQHLQYLAESMNLPTTPGSHEAAKYYGGEVRHDVPSSHVYIALATESTGLNSKEALVFSVLRAALGSGSSVKYGVGAGPLGKLITESKEPLGISAFNNSYSDSGLFGLVISTSAQNAKTAMEAAVNQLQSGNVTDGDVKRGKALVKAALLQQYESGEAVVEDIGSQALLLGSVLGAPQIAAAVDSITTANVQDAARKVASGKKSMAAYGNLRYTPYLDQLVK